MQRCLTIAKYGLGLTYPNPLVGSVIVYDNKIIGEGWHKKAGEDHAEVIAINNVKDQSLLAKSTIYVNLEPCSHYGKTPPCANLIVKMNIKNVVIGTMDYNNDVHGKGIDYLRKNGCNVNLGILEKECVRLNKRFFTFHQKKRPYIILKWAETKDGFIYPKTINRKNKEPIWISNNYSLQRVHKWRTEEEGILVGTTTALNDNPNLNARSYYGNSPIRIALDRSLKIPNSYNFYNEDLQTIIFTKKNIPLINNNIHFEVIDFSKNIIKQIIDILYLRGIQSIIIEGGAKTLQSFIDADYWDEARIFEGDNFFNNGLKSPELFAKKNKFINCISQLKIKNNKLSVYSND